MYSVAGSPCAFDSKRHDSNTIWFDQMQTAKLAMLYVYVIRSAEGLPSSCNFKNAFILSSLARS